MAERISRLISHILTYGGNKVGVTSTDGVFIDGVQILKGDYSGPEGAKAVLKDSTVDHAVLEVARGGILRRGLGFKECDVGVMTNVTSDHLGQGGIDSLESLSRLKSTVLESVKKTGWAVVNAMAVVGATYGLGVREEVIQKGLYTFNPSITQSRGRMNIIDIGDFKVLIDYCHNIGAIEATINFIKSLMPGKKIRLSSGVGNRRTEDIIEYGKVLAKHFDEIVICDPSPRNRKPGETSLILKEGILKGGMAEENITVTDEERKGAQIALKKAGPGDLVILQVDNVDQMISDVLEFKKNYSMK